MAMRILALVICLAALPLARASVAEVLPAEVRWVLRLDMAELQASPALATWLDEFAAQPEVAPKLAAFTTITAFAPREHLRSAVLAGASRDPATSFLLLEGIFDRERLVTLAKGADRYEGHVHADQLIHSWVDQGKRIYASFLRDDLLLMGGGSDAIKRVVETARGQAPALHQAEPDFARLLVPEPGQVVHGGVRDLQRFEDLHPRARIVQSVDSARVDLSEADGVLHLRAELVTGEPEEARRIAQLVQGLHAWMLLNEEGRDQPVVAELVDTFTAAHAAEVVSASMRCPIDLLKTAIREQRAAGQSAPDHGSDDEDGTR